MPEIIHGDRLPNGSNNGYCAIEDCKRQAFARGYCQSHYQRDLALRKQGYWATHPEASKRSYYRIEMARPLKSHDPNQSYECSMEGCDSPSHAKGMCKLHYNRNYYKQRKLKFLEMEAALSKPGSRVHEIVGELKEQVVPTGRSSPPVTTPTTHLKRDLEQLCEYAARNFPELSYEAIRDAYHQDMFDRDVCPDDEAVDEVFESLI